MIIKYKSVTGEITQVEVDDTIGNIIVDLDRLEYNNNQTETRRHCSLEAYNVDDTLLPSDEDVLGDVVAAEDRKELYRAITRLSERQKYLIEEVYFKGRSYADIAREEGLNRATVQRATVAAVKKLEKNLKKS